MRLDCEKPIIRKKFIFQRKSRRFFNRSAFSAKTLLSMTKLKTNGRLEGADDVVGYCSRTHFVGIDDADCVIAAR
jgi:hypothetical protein